MTIDNRNLAAGAVLVTAYKKVQHRCEVVTTEKGLGFKLANGKILSSPSSAGKAITGRVSCDGWKFWSLAGKVEQGSETPPASVREAPAKATRTAAKLVRQIKKLPNQQGVTEGSTKWFCSACMKSFLAEGQNAPLACPEGHPREAADEFAAVPQEATQTD